MTAKVHHLYDETKITADRKSRPNVVNWFGRLRAGFGWTGLPRPRRTERALASLTRFRSRVRGRLTTDLVSELWPRYPWRRHPRAGWPGRASMQCPAQSESVEQRLATAGRIPGTRGARC